MSVKREERGAWALVILGLAVLVGLMLLVSFGCASTVTPRVVASSQASWDGTNQDSGFIGFLPDHSALITGHGRDRYNALIAKYGDRFLPPLKADDGVTPVAGANAFRITAEGLEHFATMNRWRKEGK